MYSRHRRLLTSHCFQYYIIVLSAYLLFVLNGMKQSGSVFNEQSKGPQRVEAQVVGAAGWTPLPPPPLPPPTSILNWVTARRQIFSPISEWAALGLSASQPPLSSSSQFPFAPSAGEFENFHFFSFFHCLLVYSTRGEK